MGEGTEDKMEEGKKLKAKDKLFCFPDSFYLLSKSIWKKNQAQFYHNLPLTKKVPGIV